MSPFKTSPLTAQLLAHAPSSLEKTTTHPFLSQAGTQSLDGKVLLAWLVQDRLYAISYVSFIGSLLAKVNIDVSADRKESLGWRVADVLIQALVNIKREIAMFDDILRAESGRGFGQESKNGPVATTETKAYQDLFAGAAAPKQSLLVGMTALWATEKCYLESWKYAQRVAAESGNGAEGVLSDVLIPNWTSPDFEEFVITIGKVTDELAARDEVDDEEKLKCEEVWRQTLWAEQNFWPAL